MSTADEPRRRVWRWVAFGAAVVVAAGFGTWLAYLNRAEVPVVPNPTVKRLGPISLPPLPSQGRPLFTFVSLPDFINADIGELAQRRPPGHGPFDSIDGSWRTAVSTVLDQVRSEHPQAVFVAGDLVEGRWGVDVDGTGIFGPTRTEAQRRLAILRAGNLYFGQWKQRFAARGLTVYPAVGDHEIGDNPWPVGTFKQRSVSTFKHGFARNFTLRPDGTPRYASRPRGTQWEDTAYAVRIADTLLVSVDVFSNTPSGVRVTVEGGQLRWLDRVLGQARRDGVAHIIVQGHTPVLTPVRMRHSSGLSVLDGAESPFWKVLQRHQVDLYLCGEVHDMTMRHDRVVQISDGALLAHGESNYLLGRVYPDRIELELKEFAGRSDWSTRLWASTPKRPAANITIAPHPRRVGTLVIDERHGARRLLDAGGYLVEPLVPLAKVGEPADVGASRGRAGRARADGRGRARAARSRPVACPPSGRPAWPRPACPAG